QRRSFPTRRSSDLVGLLGGVIVFLKRKKPAGPQQMARPPGAPGMPPPGMPQHGMPHPMGGPHAPPPGYGAPQQQGGPMMVPGRSGATPVAKTMAIGGASASGSQPIAATA